MARIRSIKPETWTDEKVVSLSPFARLLFIGMWNFVDDEGRAVYSPARLKMQILPADSVDPSELLGEIRGEKLITVYSIDGKEYFQVNGFTKHQKVDKRTPSKIPPPPATPAEFPRISPPDQGREGKGSIPVSNETGTPLASAEDAFWSFVPDLAAKSNTTEKAMRSVMGRLKAFHDGNCDAALRVLAAAAGKDNPLTYITAAIARIRGDPRKPKHEGGFVPMHPGAGG